MQKKKTYKIITFGCQSNLSDSERIAKVMDSIGFLKTQDVNSCDVLIFNSCSVKKSAEDRVFGQARNIAKTKEKNKNIKVILTGCMLHHKLDYLDKKAPFVDIFLKIKDLHTLPKRLGYKAKVNPKEYLSFEAKHESKFRAYVPISYGCNNFCTYCIVPFSRGREYSRPKKEIINEIKNLIKKGYKEIWLLGQNVNSYGIENYSERTMWSGKTKKGVKPKIKKGCSTFTDLLKEVDKIPGDFWIRYTSPHPKDFTDDLIDIMAKSKKITNYIHLPVQSGDNKILKKMNRTYSVEHFEKLVKKIRKKIPNISITTDTIVGFSSETKKQFENTKKLYKRVGFDMAFISKYSPRPQTASQIAFLDDVSNEEKERRFKDLTKILGNEIKKKNKKLKGQVLRVLLDSKKNDKFFGRDEGMKLIEVSGENLKIGEFYNVKITETDAWALKGVSVKPKLIIILGPTASGKTSLSIELAKKFKGEVISADSRQVYKGLDIGTGKVTKKEMRGVPHHLLDVSSPKKIFDVAKFKKLSDEALKNIYKKNKVPIVCGGTGLYIDAIVKDINFPDIPQDWKLREKLEKETAENLFLKLKKLDPKRAKTIDSKNKRRLVRALEIINQTKKEVGKLKEEEKYDILYLGIKREGKELSDLILKRLKARLKQGMIKEAEREHKKGLSYKRMEALGLEYRYLALFLQKKLTKEEMIEQLNIKIRQYAKRQMTWFKRNKDIYWIKLVPEAEKLTKKFLNN
jgi:tRNA dimethylallyltransferase